MLLEVIRAEMHLFKYLLSEHFDSFFSKGTIRVGTLFEYRDAEKHGKEIGDPNEGLHRTIMNLPGGGEIDLSSDSLESRFFKRHILRPDQHKINAKVILAEGATIISETTSPNRYIYSLTSKHDLTAMQRLGTNSCMEITDLDSFFSAISDYAPQLGRFEGYYPIRYTSKVAQYTTPHRFDPAITKDLNFAYQAEWRGIWTPSTQPIRPLIIDVPRATKYCRLYQP